MIAKKQNKHSLILPIVIILVVFYISLRVMSAVELNNGKFELEIINKVLNSIYMINTKLVINAKTISTSTFITLFGIMIYETYRLQNKNNIQDSTHGSAEWKTAKDIKNKRDKKFENNIILTQTELISKDMKKSKMNKHIILLGRPGTRKVKKIL